MRRRLTLAGAGVAVVALVTGVVALLAGDDDGSLGTVAAVGDPSVSTPMLIDTPPGWSLVEAEAPEPPDTRQGYQRDVVQVFRPSSSLDDALAGRGPRVQVSSGSRVYELDESGGVFGYLGTDEGEDPAQLLTGTETRVYGAQQAAVVTLRDHDFLLVASQTGTQLRATDYDGSATTVRLEGAVDDGYAVATIPLTVLPATVSGPRRRRAGRCPRRALTRFAPRSGAGGAGAALPDGYGIPGPADAGG